MTGFSYAALTHQSPNALKLWAQNHRLGDALAMAGAEPLGHVVDYGAGDGELALRLLRLRPDAEVICFEPARLLRNELKTRLRRRRVRVVSRARDLPAAWADTVFCLEVLEHLPSQQIETALAAIRRTLAPGGALVVGVPVEIGPPALAKAAFRGVSRPGDADSRWIDVSAAVFGRPAGKRPLSALGDGLAYYRFHLGFDHRALLRRLASSFGIERRTGSPFRFGPFWVNSELHILARKPS